MLLYPFNAAMVLTAANTAPFEERSTTNEATLISSLVFQLITAYLFFACAVNDINFKGKSALAYCCTVKLSRTATLRPVASMSLPIITLPAPFQYKERPAVAL